MTPAHSVHRGHNLLDIGNNGASPRPKYLLIRLSNYMLLLSVMLTKSWIDSNKLLQNPS